MIRGFLNKLSCALHAHHLSGKWNSARILQHTQDTQAAPAPAAVDGDHAGNGAERVDGRRRQCDQQLPAPAVHARQRQDHWRVVPGRRGRIKQSAIALDRSCLCMLVSQGLPHKRRMHLCRHVLLQAAAALHTDDGCAFDLARVR